MYATRLRLRSLVIISASLAAFAATTGTAVANTTTTTPTIASVIGQAKELGSVMTQSSLEADGQALEPAVKAAIAGDSQNVQTLLAADNPAISAALLDMATVTNTTSTTPTPGGATSSTSEATGDTITPDSSGCWGPAYDIQSASVLGSYLWWREIEVDWCGDGTYVTSATPSYTSWTNVPYCFVNVEHNQGYLAGPAGAHVWWFAENYAEVGQNTGDGCLGEGVIASPWVKVKGDGYATWGDNPGGYL
jgi:hypothetical protein